MNNDLFIRVVLMLAIITFVKQLPKQIGDITGIKSEGMKMGLSGLKERFSEGGGFTAGAAIGGGAKSLAQSGVSSFKNGKGLGILKDAALGGISGTLRSGYQARGAKSYSDMQAGANKGAQGVADSLDKKYSNAARYGMKNVKLTDPKSYVNAVTNPFKYVAGKTGDAGNAVADWSGANSTEGLDKEIKLLEEAKSFKDKLEKAVENDSGVQASKSIQKTILEGGVDRIKKLNPGYSDAQARAELERKIGEAKTEVDRSVALAVKAKYVAGDDAEINSIEESYKAFINKNASNTVVAGLEKTLQPVETSVQISTATETMLKGISFNANNSAIKKQLYKQQGKRAKLIDKKKEAQGSK